MNILITGGCGFIGCNAAARFAQLGHHVTLLDNLSRACTDLNLTWLRQRPTKLSGQAPFRFVNADVRDASAVNDLMREGGFGVVLHLAAQVAVTTSVKDPVNDFQINAVGTFNVLDALRRHCPEAVFLNASTNKVYGKLHGLPTVETPTRYTLANGAVGVAESQPLDFHSPYGCSKGAADQYTVDYARIYGLRTVNFRQSCIYGLRQFGMEDQGWVAWFMIAHELGKPITVYGTGKQVRDLLFVDDLVECYLRAVERSDGVAGMTFNVGGGPENALSIVEFFDLLGGLSGRPVVHQEADWRPGDERIYVSDNRRACELLDWRPRTQVQEGIVRLRNWVVENRSVLAGAGCYS
jgi:CDP-paratose 2-epimerase